MRSVQAEREAKEEATSARVAAEQALEEMRWELEGNVLKKQLEEASKAKARVEELERDVQVPTAALCCSPSHC